MLDAGEVGWRRKGEEVREYRIALVEGREQVPFVDAQFGNRERRIADLGAPGAGELAHAVDGIVVVGGQQQPFAGLERKGVPADELQRARRVEGEDRGVVACSSK